MLPLPQLSYQVAMPQPQNHLFVVTLQVSPWAEEVLNFKIPVWTPGSYLVREYTRHLQDMQAQDGQGRPLTIRKLAKNHWQIAGADTITIQYRIFANELTVRTNHLDSSHGYFNPSALCGWIPGYEQQPLTVTIAPPAGWQVTTPLPGQGYTFTAQNFDELVDSPFEIGQHRVYDFIALDRPHQLAIWGDGLPDPSQLIGDIQKIIPAAAAIFGGQVPYDRYLFLLHLTAQSYGGLEHKNCCSLIYPRWQLAKPDQYRRFLQLIAHEFFHLWNVKRIFPAGLEKFDYDGENYTQGLWFSEGVTSYYDLLIPHRAGLYDRSTLLQELSKEVSRYLTTPGRLVQPLAESSFDAWIKLYRPDANSGNSQMSYYLKGAMVTWLLDLKIRALSQSDRSFDDVLRHLWESHGTRGRGFSDGELEELIQKVAGVDLGDFFHRYLYGLDELPFDEYLRPLGLYLQPITPEPTPSWGMTIKGEQGKALIKTVVRDGPGAIAGLEPGDELLAIEGYRVAAEQVAERLGQYQPGQRVEVTVVHHDRLVTHQVVLAAPEVSQYELTLLGEVTPQQLYNLQAWAGV
jgi:predicted metalloprotease with PDZ domain